MYFSDHAPPHFHARHPDGYAKVRIDTLKVMKSTLRSRDLRLVKKWARLHQDELMDNWNRARLGGTLQWIEPLR